MKRLHKTFSNFQYKQFSTIWMLFIVPFLALLVNIFFAEAQSSYGITSIFISVIFLVILILEIVFLYRKVLCNILRESVYPRLEVAISQQPQDTSGYDYVFKESIISDKELAAFESNCSCEEIWVVSNDLATEIDGGLYADVVPNNLERGIKYKLFVPKNNLTSIRLEQHRRKNGNSNNIQYYLLTDDFFFLVSRLDFTIYDPYKTSATGRRGYIGLDLPGHEELFAAKIEDSLVDAIASKLLDYIRADKLEQW